ncbi:oxygen-independent coproporphyrinogen III oxidase [Roseinatronobacter alkalisoli]|uniref:Coproporphyrinogen-III oxidase n=1 Tax=Roseinatronobacter alkalisoli TaxID=3028235 RepID=A0ABT5TAG5_9RHOB|nr:oxygen-independent coproporphyrinogen III oxidase [Roseinatronobacter sp. HJB301]MDD7972119.1 oxygen-independent coproporphyrinogen III oxidase [Roseinatronobacter sp. HJB301]
MSYLSQLTKLGLFDARVPRYTSYPTAPQFGTGLSEGVFTGWIGQIPPGSEVSLYLHVPFCRRLCWFCACRTQGTSSNAPVLAYVDSLRAELELLRAILPEGVHLSRLHWGGGTPTLLPAAQMRELAALVFSIAPLADGGEFSVEIDPNEIDDERLDALAAAGMNRASIGVQDFDPEIQKIIGRDQSFEITKAAVDGLRARGIASLNADILYGLPHQTPKRISDSVQKLLSLNPDRVALYGYAHVPWMARRQQMIPSETLPRPEERLDLFDTARRLFLWDGYDEIGIDHFARPHDSMAKAAAAGTLRRNFQGYTDDTSPVLIGLGASSISRFPQGYAQNAPATADWKKAVHAGQFATARGHIFTPADIWRGRAIESLMCDFAINRNELVQDFNASPAEVDALFDLAVQKYGEFVQRTSDGLQIPAEGRPLTRIIATIFDEYAMAKAGHSSAV